MRGGPTGEGKGYDVFDDLRKRSDFAAMQTQAYGAQESAMDIFKFKRKERPLVGGDRSGRNPPKRGDTKWLRVWVFKLEKEKVDNRSAALKSDLHFAAKLYGSKKDDAKSVASSRSGRTSLTGASTFQDSDSDDDSDGMPGGGSGDEDGEHDELAAFGDGEERGQWSRRRRAQKEEAARKERAKLEETTAHVRLRYTVDEDVTEAEPLGYSPPRSVHERKAITRRRMVTYAGFERMLRNPKLQARRDDELVVRDVVAYRCIHSRH